MSRLRYLLCLLLLVPASALAQNGPPSVIPASQHDVSPPLRELPPAPRQVGALEAEPVRQIPSRRLPFGPDPVVQGSHAAATRLAPVTTSKFEGIGQGFTGPSG